MKLISYIRILLITVFIAGTGIANAQKTSEPYLKFKRLKNLPNILEWPATVTDGKYIYAINSYTNTGFSPNVLKFNPQTSKWTVINNEAGYKLQASAAYCPSNGHVYIFGGTDYVGKKPFLGVQSMDVNTGILKGLVAYNPMPATYGCAAEWNKLIYIFGGTQNGNNTIATMYSFDPQTLEFTRLADMPERLQTAGAIVNGILYTFGGYDNFLERKSDNINAYDIKTNTWKTVATLPKPISANTVAVCGDLIFVIGDYTEENFLGYYNTRTNTFVKLNSNMFGHRAGGAAIINNTLYVFGGKTDPNKVTGGINTVQAADITHFLDMISANAN